MAINSTTRQTTAYTTGNNFAFAFKVFTTADVKVIKIQTSNGAETVLNLNSDYTVTLNGDQDNNPGGSVTLSSGSLGSGSLVGFNIVITSKVEAKQLTELTNQGGFFPSVINNALDKSVILHQQQQNVIDKTIRFKQTDGITGLEITDGATTRATKTISFDSNGNVTLIGPVVTTGDTGTVTTNMIGDDQVTPAKIGNADLKNLSSCQTGGSAALSDLTQAEVQILDGATVSTTELNKIDGLTAAASDLNKLDGMTATKENLSTLTGITAVETSVTVNSNAKIPTSKAVNDLVLAVTNALGGFVAIANATSFPTSHPDPSENAGTVVSITDANGIVVNSSGVATIPAGAGQDQNGNNIDVTINGFPTDLRSRTLGSGIGLQVQTTTTLHTYDYHKALIKESDLVNFSADVDSFRSRYRVVSTTPTSDNDEGDIIYRTSDDKLLIYNGTAFQDPLIGNFHINTLSSYNGTGGNTATFNGSAYRFNINHAPEQAQQLLVSINGVIQKPNSGTSQPSEGFALNGDSILFGAAPASGSDFFIITIGKSVNIGVVSDGTINNAKVASDASIEGTKINPNFGSQNISTTGTLGTGNITISSEAPILTFTDTNYNNGNPIYRFAANNGRLVIQDIAENFAERFAINADNHIDLNSNVDISGLLTVTSDLILTDANPSLFFTEVGNVDPDYKIFLNQGIFRITDETNSADRFVINTDGSIDFPTNCDFASGIDVTGQIVSESTTGTGSTGLKVSNSNESFVQYFEGGGADATFVMSYTGSGGTDIRFKHNGEIQLNHAGQEKFKTTSTGIDVTGNLTLPDNGQLQLGGATGGDFKIYHSGSHGFISNTTGNLYILANAGGDVGGDIHIRPKDGENSISCLDDAAVSLYYDGGTYSTPKLATTATGVSISGITSISGSTGTSSGPTLDLETTNSTSFIHSAHIFAPNMTNGQHNSIYLGKATGTKNTAQIAYKYYSNGSNDNLLTFSHWSANDLVTINGQGNTTIAGNLAVDTNTLFVDSTNDRVGVNNATPSSALDVTGMIRSYAASGGQATSGLRIGTATEAADIYFSSGSANAQFNITYGGSGGNDIAITHDGIVKLFNGGGTTPKLETTSTGIKVNPVVTIDGSTPRLQMKPTADVQSHRIEFFNTADSIVSRIYGDPSTGNLEIQTGSSGNEKAIKVNSNGAVDLHFDGGTYSTPKLSTSATGVTVDGTLTADDLKISGVSPSLEFEDTNATADNQRWDIKCSGSDELLIQALTDAGGGGGNLFKFTRDGNSIQTFQGLRSGVTWLTVDNINRKVTTRDLDVTGTIISTVSAANADFLTLTANMGNNNGRFLKFSSPDNDSGSEPFNINSNNAIEFEIDNIRTLFIDDDGQVNLHHDGSSTAKLSTTATGVNVEGTATISNIGNNQGLNLDGANNNTCLHFTSTGSSPAHGFRIAFHSPTNSRFGSPALLFDKINNSTRAFDSHIAGISDDGFHLDDNKKIHLGSQGATGDLQIYHNALNSWIVDQGTGHLIIGSNGDRVRIAKGAGAESMAEFITDGANELYFDGGTYSTPKLATTAVGVDIDGSLVVQKTTGNSINLGTTVGNGNDSHFRFKKARGGNTPAIVAANDSLGTLEWQPHDGTDYQGGAFIKASIDGTPASGDVPTRLVFGTRAAGAGNTSTRMTIQASGQVDFTGDVVATGDGTFDDLRIGEWSHAAVFAGVFHKNQTGQEYMILSSDTHTYLSASTGSSVYIRGGNNSQTNQIEVDPTAGINITAANNVNILDGIIDFSSSADDHPYIKMKDNTGTAARVKYAVWSSSGYGMGMTSGMSYGSIGNQVTGGAEFATTFQMNNSNSRGWIFLDSSHSNAQGAMSLTTQGRMTVAHSMRLGYGESDTTESGATHALDVSGSAIISSSLTAGGLTFPTSNGTDGQVLTSTGTGTVQWEDATGGGGSSFNGGTITSDLTISKTDPRLTFNNTQSSTDDYYFTMSSSSFKLFRTPSTGGSDNTRINITSTNIILYQSANCTGTFKVNDNFIPATDDSSDIGSGSLRFDDIFATNTTIQTSDERLKQDIQALTTAEKAVATTLKGLIKTFKYKSAIAAKGDKARIHCGVIAQEVKTAFEAQGLKAEDYALFCYDKWDAIPEVKDDEGTVIEPAVAAGNRYSIRYTELLAFIISVL